jgi:hypothetical protein
VRVSPGGAGENASPVTANAHAKEGARRSGRPVSVEIGKRAARRKEPLHMDEMKETKRRKVIMELYETERAYVDGLDLIYSVRIYF